MSTQTEAQRLAERLKSRRILIGDHGATLDEAAELLLCLEAANAELLAALKMNAQALSWLAFGECRGFTDNLPTALEATGAASAAIKKHGGAA